MEDTEFNRAQLQKKLPEFNSTEAKETMKNYLTDICSDKIINLLNDAAITDSEDQGKLKNERKTQQRGLIVSSRQNEYFWRQTAILKTIF